MTTEFENDIGTALIRLQHAFRSHGMEVAAVQLADYRDGLRLKNDMPRMAMLIFDETTKMPQNEMEFAGIRIRWPAVPVALPGGGYRYD